MSIRKRRWQSPKGEREAWVLDYIDHKGRRRHKTFKTKGDAKSFRTTAEAEISQGVHVTDRDTITIAEAAQNWIAGCEEEDLERTTLRGYEALVNHAINPLIGHMRLNRFWVTDVVEFRKTLRNTPYADDFPVERFRGRKRSKDAVRRAVMALGAIFGDAILNSKAAHNPVAAEPKKSRRKGDARAKLKTRIEVGVHIPTNEEVRLIVENAKGWYANLIVTAVFTGLRASELRGLRWRDVNLDKGHLEVRQRADAWCVLGPPKSAAGFRTVPLTPTVISILRDWRAKCPPNPFDLVFPSKKGTVAYYNNIRKSSVFPTMRAAGLMVESGKTDAKGNPKLQAKYPGLHALRHWYASWCINRVEDGGLGFSAKKVQERMGHSTIQLTMDVYGHLFPTKNETEELARGEAAFWLQQERDKSGSMENDE